MIESGLPGVALAERDHICAFFRGAEERDALLRSFFGAGLSAGDKCLCVTDDPETVAEMLLPGRARHSDQLTVLGTNDYYLVDGEFVPAPTLERLESILSDYVARDGCDRFRMTGELGWSARQHTPSELLLEYEAGSNAVVDHFPVTLLCLYDLDLIGAELVGPVMQRHTATLVRGVLFRGGAGVASDGSDPTGLRQAELGVLVDVVRLLIEGRPAPPASRAFGEVARDLLDGRLDVAAPIALGAMDASGIDFSAPVRVAVMEGFPADNDRIGTMLEERGVRLVAARAGEMGFVLPAEADWRELAASLEDVAAGIRLAVGGPASGAAECARSYLEARQALVVGAERGAVCFDDLGILRLLGAGADMAAVEAFVEEWLGPLLAYDGSRGVDLVPTLMAFLDCGANYAASAEALRIHVSTLRYRLGRMVEITGRDLTDPETRFQFQLALRARRSLDVLRPGEAR